MMTYTGRLRPKGVPFLAILFKSISQGQSPRSTTNDGLYGEAPPERDAFFSDPLQKRSLGVEPGEYSQCWPVRRGSARKGSVFQRSPLEAFPRGRDRGVLPMMAYTGRLRPKGVPFLAILFRSVSQGQSPGSAPNVGLYGKILPESGAFFNDPLKKRFLGEETEEYSQ